jgi:hypothetical protein
MSTTIFQIDEEIDKLVDKFSQELKLRLKKTVMRSQKVVLKQYIASQKETNKDKKSSKKSSKMDEVKVVSSSKNQKSPIKLSYKKINGESQRQNYVKVKREQDYTYVSDSE